MTKSWRPNGWDKQYPNKPLTYITLLDTEAARERVYFEAGADAILEALEKIPDTIIIDDQAVTLRLKAIMPRHQRGQWVFIPDDEVK